MLSHEHAGVRFSLAPRRFRHAIRTGLVAECGGADLFFCSTLEYWLFPVALRAAFGLFVTCLLSLCVWGWGSAASNLSLFIWRIPLVHGAGCCGGASGIVSVAGGWHIGKLCF